MVWQSVQRAFVELFAGAPTDIVTRRFAGRRLIVTGPREFVDRVAGDIVMIESTRSGSLLMEVIAKNPAKRIVTIEQGAPYYDKTTPDNHDYDSASIRDINGSCIRAWCTFGPGTNSTVRYGASDIDFSKHPDPKEAKDYTGKPWAFTPSDVVLFHELMHAVDMIYGVLDNTLLPEDPKTGQSYDAAHAKALGIEEATQAKIRTYEEIVQIHKESGLTGTKNDWRALPRDRVDWREILTFSENTYRAERGFSCPLREF
jgi:hypothetical protein